jgi:type IV secretion system protein VirB2
MTYPRMVHPIDRSSDPDPPAHFMLEEDRPMFCPKISAIDNPTRNFPRIERTLLCTLLVALALSVPDLALAQASPFLTGANAIQTNILTWLTPVAIILVMVLGAMAMANRMSWGWCIGAVIGIAIAFGAPQIVTWIRGMFAV